MEKVVAIASGGLDSTTLLYYLKQKGLDVYVLNFDYGSKHNAIESRCAKWHANNLKMPFTKIKLDFASWGFKSNLLKDGGRIPEGHYSADTMKATVVPFRNGIMLSIAVGYAESIGATAVYLGSHKGDRAQYPDCKTEFTQAISKAAEEGTGTKIKIVSPFNELMKWDIVAMGLTLKVEYAKTHSCYNGERPPCGKCSTCVERVESFMRNNERDPLYAYEHEWILAKEETQRVLDKFNEKGDKNSEA